jgi:catechol 2,3-dioxygenase-like lactoylglutathione lyase family enzyme
MIGHHFSISALWKAPAPPGLRFAGENLQAKVGNSLSVRSSPAVHAEVSGLNFGDRASYLEAMNLIYLQEVPMAIVLDHTIVPARDKELSARFLARILGLRYEGPLSHFAPVRVNDTLTLDFDNDTEFESHHYAFKVDETEFDEIFNRVRAEGISYGSGPGSLDDMKINHRRGGRGFYFRDPNGHVLEVLTA